MLSSSGHHCVSSLCCCPALLVCHCHPVSSSHHHHAIHCCVWRRVVSYRPWSCQSIVIMLCWSNGNEWWDWSFIFWLPCCCQQHGTWIVCDYGNGGEGLDWLTWVCGGAGGGCLSPVVIEVVLMVGMFMWYSGCHGQLSSLVKGGGSGLWCCCAESCHQHHGKLDGLLAWHVSRLMVVLFIGCYCCCCCSLLLLFIVVGANWQVVPLLFFWAQTWPHGLCMARGYIRTHQMTIFSPRCLHLQVITSILV